MNNFNAPPGQNNLFQQGITTQNTNQECTLYVGNLNPQLLETRLYDYFRHYGDIVNCRIMRDIYSGESRRFAFVSFNKKEDAQKALDKLNYFKLDGWELRICFKKSRDDFKPEGNIFVKNISTEVSTKELNEKFQEFGKIVSCTIRNDDQGKSLGYGYVQYETEENAVKAIEAMNNQEFKGTKLDVSKFVTSKNRNTELKNLYMKNFPKNFNKEKIEEFLNKDVTEIGKITSSGIFDKDINGEKKFFAFVAFEEQDQAKAVVDKFNNHKFTEEDLPLYVGFAQNKKQRKEELRKAFQTGTNQTNIYIRSLKPDVDENAIRQVFEKYGPITSICIKTNQKKIPKLDV